jgi:uncharacterized protein (DUF2147 family)
MCDRGIRLRTRPFGLLMGATLLLSIWHSRSASSEVPGGTWMFANRVALKIIECTGQLCGPAGRPDLDTLNRDPLLRQRHLRGLRIIWSPQPGDQGHWTGGSLYDPKDGVTYDLSAELITPATMSARVYRGGLKRTAAEGCFGLFRPGSRVLFAPVVQSSDRSGV